MRQYWAHVAELCKNRIFVMLGGICIMFLILVLRLFSLQIIHGEEHNASITASVSKEVNVLAPRGNIYDRYGRPLAVNSVAYSVQIDNSASLDLEKEDKHNLLVELTQSIWAYGGTAMDILPIALEYPYEFIFEGTEKEQKKAEKEWKESQGMTKDLADAQGLEVLEFLFEKYNAPTSYTQSQKRAFVSYHQELSDLNIMALCLSQQLAQFDEVLIDSLPLGREYPYTLEFGGNQVREKEFKQSVAMTDHELEYNSLETLEYLRDFFGLPQGLPTDLVRDTVGIRYSLYLQRYQQYQSVTLATQINDKTLAYVEEKQDVFSNVVINTVSLREYPEAEYFSHIIGYIRQMTEDGYSVYEKDLDAQGQPLYSKTDIVGQTGMEKLYERELNGIDGKVFIEVDNQGRRMSVLDSTEPTPGKDVFLTLDAKLQKVTYDALEKELVNGIKAKLTRYSKDSVSVVDLFFSMIESNNISASKIMRAEDGVQKQVYDMFLSQTPDFDLEGENAVQEVQNFLIDGVSLGGISTKQCLLMAIEQGTIPSTLEEIAEVENGSISVLGYVLNKLDSGELKPADTGLDPSTGSVFVTKVDSGEVLASVSYPSYDNNELVNNFNNGYYNDLLQDTNTPLVNRPLKQKKAPGSTFKMVTALAGLETETIQPNTLIRDMGVFKDAGTPHARCWIYSSSGRTHGAVNVVGALEVSCNYFFYELVYRMGNAQEGNTIESITSLNEYMAAFGLNKVSGVELEEYVPTIASPYDKNRVVKIYNPDATESQTRWTDGDTIRAAMGQSVNSYTPAQMTKYIATLANGGTLYKLHMVDYIKNFDGSVYKDVEEVIENVTEFEQENLDAVYEGMYQVSYGSRGILRHKFVGFPMEVATKTGTAQEDLSRSSHTWLVAYAPYDDPQIAITIMIPFGDGSASSAPEIVKAIITEYFGLDDSSENANLETILSQ